jgi:hypothetical protein
MKDINLKLNQYVVYAIYVFCALTLLNTCSTRSANSENRKLRKELEATNNKIDSLASREEIEMISNRVMFDFLIYEDDVDKNKASLSDIKTKIDRIEKELKNKK